MCNKCGSDDPNEVCDGCSMIEASAERVRPFDGESWQACVHAVFRKRSEHFSECVAVCEGNDRHHNARLIAAAPEMLALLRRAALVFLKEHRQLTKEIETLIERFER
jgi:hypothetical protein